MAARIVKNAQAITEWYSRIDGTIEACGQASVAMALHVLKNTPATPQFVTALAQETVNAREVVDWPHASTAPDDLKWLLFKHKASATIHWNDWESSLRAQAGHIPVIVGVSNADALGGHDRGIHGHYICVFGVDGGGAYIVGDPNTPESTSGAFVTYTPAQIDAADPFAVIVPQESPLPGPINTVVAPVNGLLYSAPGFDGIVQLIATDEVTKPLPNVAQPSSLDSLNPSAWAGWMGALMQAWFGWVASNVRAWIIRTVFILVGLFLILGVLIQVMKRADPDFWESLKPQMAAAPGGGMGAMPLGALPNLGGNAGAGAGGGAEAGAGAGLADVAPLAAL